ncbi:NAD(P)/FAD-dependent oxidoreductase [Variovorax arabinosiphilus]|uniref:NAD(P)/FAD-dependent oxidoreductase n=1 Tax=Variovorax arabinosiphilus TaxID=3053498 RepID=UPI002575D353|nr:MULTISPECIES: NAD(P)/FAD-dependent oxidoreductase [unclassified Variovorax]MDM0119524.1 NAD(P)/FAD-dependent oxidoreductase [Variovorax sp. J2L1-78]MDM0128564.1 NAD(P)/FAD-dependent oxidoreductase [Variovorax sp. J2L1-63]MDM0232264.1 NAD(P)/FAD-dependent oxidoreductase [Variovorax sp. J2R1-6]
MTFDAVVIGAGAAGLFCAAQAGQRGRKVLLIDHSERVAEKIRISGGGRCNFTNRDIDVRAPQRHFVSENPNFCRSALSRYTSQQFIGLIERHGIAYHEKHKGQLFCDGPSQQIIDMLLAECDAGGVTRWQPCAVRGVAFDESQALYCLDTDRGRVETPQLVVATGGLSIPQLGASDFGYRLAQQFGLRLVAPRPALVPLTFAGDGWAPYAGLAGLALPVQIETGRKKERIAFLEDLLFTHRGLSGPAVLQISSYWREGEPLTIDFAPGTDVAAALGEAKSRSRKRIANELAALVPSRLADAWVGGDPALQRPVNEAADKALNQLAERVSRWAITPAGTEGYKKAEVTAGGVDTRDLSSQTLESKQPGLFFIGEVVDVTGWLGGYNFQWAWASAHACANAL